MRNWLIAVILLGCGAETSAGLDATPVRDAAPRDGAIEPPPGAILVTCDQTYTTMTAIPDLYTITTTTYWGELVVDGFDPRAAHAVTVALCDPQQVGTHCPPPVGCPDGGTCSTEGPPPPTPECYIGFPILLPGAVVVSCGNRSAVDFVNPIQPDSDCGTIYGAVYVRVE